MTELIDYLRHVPTGEASSDDVPSPIDLREDADAHDWAAEADRKRPWRVGLREEIARLVHTTLEGPGRVLELGAGPGLLAKSVLSSCTLESYTLLDFSAPMLAMSRERLREHPNAFFVQADFKDPDWPRFVRAPFDVVVAMQSVHELRHKPHLPQLYSCILPLLRTGGVFIVCDHEPPDASARCTALFATESEQHVARTAAGFRRVHTRSTQNGLYLCAGTR